MLGVPTRFLGCHVFSVHGRSITHISIRFSSRIFILKSGNIYRNLAFEASLYADYTRFTPNAIGQAPPTDILLWRSEPCVVIGRFQNAWNEVRMDLLRQRRWSLARRESGGGAVYHDPGNLNICFMQSRRVLDRRKCMQLLQKALQPLLNDRIVHVGDRYDLWVSPCTADHNDCNQLLREKISGSSSRLGSKVAYHHCTLLCEANLDNLSGVLQPSFATLKTKASTSVRSPVVNLGLPVEQVQQTIIDCVSEWIGQNDGSLTKPKILQVFERSEWEHVDRDRFQQKMNQFQQWRWIYGSSPAFNLDLQEAAVTSSTKLVESVRLYCDRGGHVSSLQLTEADHFGSELCRFVSDLSNALTGLECRPFAWHNALDQFWSNQVFADPGMQWDTEKMQLIDALKTLSIRF